VRFHSLPDAGFLLTTGRFRVPPFLDSIDDPRLAQGGSSSGCPVCGGECGLLVFDRLLTFLQGLGHSISNCPKLEDAQRRQMASHRQVGNEGGGY